MGANSDFSSINLFAYCGNNPVVRQDTPGDVWFVSIGVGIATQYIGDVIGNLLSGKKGLDILRPTSSVGEYIAAGVTALIPGSGFTGALVRNTVAEGISIIENVIMGKQVSFSNSATNIVLGAALDAGFEKVSDKVTDYVRSKMPNNYSSYAHTVRKSKPNLSKEQIQQSMQRSIRYRRVIAKGIAIGLDVGRTLLPY